MAKSPHFERASRSHSSMSLNLISVDRSSIALSVLLCGAIVADRGQLPRLLGAYREWPSRLRAAAQQRDELASPHSITSAAQASSVSGKVTPSALAALGLMTSSTFVTLNPVF